MVVNIGNEISVEELQLITGGNEGVFQAGTFDILEDRTDDIHNITCSKCFAILAMALITC